MLNIEGSSEGVSEPIRTLIVGTTLIWSHLLATKLTTDYDSSISNTVYIISNDKLKILIFGDLKYKQT